MQAKVEREGNTELQQLVNPGGDGGSREMSQYAAQRRLRDVG
jgi:hypothetical protein